MHNLIQTHDQFITDSNTLLHNLKWLILVQLLISQGSLLLHMISSLLIQTHCCTTQLMICCILIQFADSNTLLIQTHLLHIFNFSRYWFKHTVQLIPIMIWLHLVQELSSNRVHILWLLCIINFSSIAVLCCVLVKAQLHWTLKLWTLNTKIMCCVHILLVMCLMISSKSTLNTKMNELIHAAYLWTLNCFAEHWTYSGT